MTESATPFAPLPKTFWIHLRMDSDWHVGSGVGRPGDVDRLVARDHERLPFVPGKTLAGILRDAAEAVAWAFDEKRRGPWSASVRDLFGDQPGATRDGEAAAVTARGPRPSRICFRDARFPDHLRRAFEGNRELAESVTFVKPGVAINPLSGRAKEDHLRFEEMARSGVTLVARCEWDPPDAPEQALAATALLLAAAAFVERLGGKRRRGAGRCAVTIAPTEAPVVVPPLEAALDWIATHRTPRYTAARSIPQSTSQGSSRPALAPADGPWWRIALRIRTESPVVVTSAVLGNVQRTLDHIPGRLLLPDVVRVIAARGIDTTTAIARGELVVTDATLEIGSDRGRPVPLALFERKGKGSLATGEGALNLFRETADEQLKQCRAGWIGPTPAHHLPAFERTKIVSRTHATIDDEPQRPTERVGGVFTYEAIAPGTDLRFEVRLSPRLHAALAAASPDWWTELGGSRRIGRARKDSYGQTCVEVLTGPQEAAATRLADTRHLTMWLVSDLLVLDGRLRPSARPKDVTQALSEALGCSVRLASPVPNGTGTAFLRERRTDSWQTRWGLPRPTLVGVAAGSCFRFEIDSADVPQDLERRLAEIEVKGLGLRRAEGFGEVVFDDPLLTRALANETGDPSNIEFEDKPARYVIPAPNPENRGTQGELDFARVVERAAWRTAIRNQVLHAVADEQFRREHFGLELTKAGSKPSFSQLGRLRSAVARLTDADTSRTRLLEWLQRVDEHQRDWPEAKQWPQRTRATLRNLVDDPSKVWHLLELAKLDDLVITPNGAGALRGELWAEAVRTVVTTALRAHKRDAERKPSAGAKGAAEPAQCDSEVTHGA